MDGEGEAARGMVVGSCTREAMINPIMMRFRPIAPKPVAGGSVSAAPSTSVVRTKRKYVRVTRYNRKKKITRSSNTAGESVGEHAAVSTTTTAATLQLLPERGHAVEVWATVECVTEARSTEMGVELGRTDEERKKNLEEDTCPGFVSDGENRVEWLNKAFIRMVRQRSSGGGEGESPGVRLVINISEAKIGLGFTCQIKLQFKMEKEVKLVPCDAWRMDGGGFAWKLDVKAALTLAPLLQEDFQ